jgi:abortive infection bacteriophage resistance protein
MTVPYPKPWLPISAQLKKLESRGLAITDHSAAEQFLLHLNYYRFSGYGLAFEDHRHHFRPGTTFSAIRSAYEFDRDLRDLITESLEVIELDLRAVTAYTFGQRHGPFGHSDAARFFRHFDHAAWLRRLHDEIRRSREPFVTHFKATYSEFPDLPIWVTTELMSFGALSRMYGGMQKADQKAIASRYGLQPQTLKSWIHHLVYTRNLCAHHLRIWDRCWSIKPDLPAGRIWRRPELPSNSRLFAALLVQMKMLVACDAERAFTQSWRVRVEDILSQRAPKVADPLIGMGLLTHWKQHPVWRPL